jgi:hypothetical protein
MSHLCCASGFTRSSPELAKAAWRRTQSRHYPTFGRGLWVPAAGFTRPLGREVWCVGAAGAQPMIAADRRIRPCLIASKRGQWIHSLMPLVGRDTLGVLRCSDRRLRVTEKGDDLGVLVGRLFGVRAVSTEPTLILKGSGC